MKMKNKMNISSDKRKMLLEDDEEIQNEDDKDIDMDRPILKKKKVE